MRNALTTLLVIAIGAATVFGMSYLVKAVGSGEQWTVIPEADASENKEPPAPIPARQSNPWSKTLNVSASDAATIAGAIETAFDENQLRRRVILGLWSEGHNADDIAVITGYRVSTVLDAMRNYRNNVERRSKEINTTYAAETSETEGNKVEYSYEVAGVGAEDTWTLTADEVRPGKNETTFFLAGDLVAEFQNSNIIGWTRLPTLDE